MKVYTKTGDKKTTGVIGGRVSKSSKRIECYGTTDEALSYIGNVYYYGLSMHKRALQSTSQINGCGWLEQKISFNYKIHLIVSNWMHPNYNNKKIIYK